MFLFVRLVRPLTLHVYYWLFHFCLTTGYKFKSISMSSLGCVLTGYVLATVSMIGLALLGWSSFEFDTNG